MRRFLIVALTIALLPASGSATGPCNNAPTALADVAGTVVDRPLILDPLANDSDPEGQPLTAVVSSNGCPGQLETDPAGTLTFRPPAGFAGACTILYRAQDSEGLLSAEVAMSVAVNVPTAIFFDGFESGDLTAWSEVVP